MQVRALVRLLAAGTVASGCAGSASPSTRVDAAPGSRR